MTQMCFFMRHFSFNFFGKVFAKLLVPHHAGATGVWHVQCRTIAFEGHGNLIWEIHMAYRCTVVSYPVALSRIVIPTEGSTWSH